jgi:creatinine amidohydrolase
MENNLYSYPHDQLQEFLKLDVPVYVFVNPIEYHGPHLSLHTDKVLSMGMAKKLHKELEKEKGDMPFLIAEDIALGEGPTMGPGSIHTPFKDLKKIILRCSKSLVRQGVKKVIFMTFHGAPMHNIAIQAGIDYLHKNGVRAYNPFNHILHKMIHFNPRDYDRVRKFLPQECNQDEIVEKFNNDFHAGIFETSLCLYLCPDTVSENYKAVPNCPPLIPNKAMSLVAKFFKFLGNTYLFKELSFAAIGLAWIQLRPFPGYSGTPKYSSKELGQHFVEKELIPLYLSGAIETLYNDHKGPEPVMKWIYAFSLGGAISI